MKKPTISDYIALTKPTIMLLVLMTGLTALVVEGNVMERPIDVILIMVALYCVGGAANALNQYFERDVDAQMERTREKRPLPSKRLSPNQALVFIIVIGLTGIFIFALQFNSLSVFLSVFTIGFYSFFYTRFLKPRTPQNIVIGGAAGAMGPVIAWAAATGSVMNMVPWALFLIIFFWTPPHFWALALFSKNDYKTVRYPMMPVAKGDVHTHKLMLMYTMLMMIAGFSIMLHNPAGFVDSQPLSLFYSVTSFLLGGYFVYLVWKVMTLNSEKSQKSLFAYSILYIFSICFTIMIDAVWI